MNGDIKQEWTMNNELLMKMSFGELHAKIQYIVVQLT